MYYGVLGNRQQWLGQGKKALVQGIIALARKIGTDINPTRKGRYIGDYS